MAALPVSANIDSFLRSADYAAARTALGVLALAGGTVTGQLVATAQSTSGAIKVSPTWTGGGTYKALCIDQTDTSSNAASLAIEVLHNGSTVFSVSKLGTTLVMGGSSITADFGGAGRFRIGSTSGLFINPGTQIQLANNTSLGWSSTAASGSNLDDVTLVRDAAGVLALKVGTAAQKFRVYGTTTGSKYVQLEHNGTFALLSSSSGGLKIGTGSELIGFFGVDPIARQTNITVASATHTAGSGTAVTEDSTFGGYTIGQLAQMLIDFGFAS